MRKSLVIATPVFCVAGTVLRLLSLSDDSFPHVMLGGQKFTFAALISILAIVFAVVVMILTRKDNGGETVAPKASGAVLFAAAIAFGFDAVQKVLENVLSDAPFDAFALLLGVFEFISAIVIVIFACQIFTGFDFKYKLSLLLALIPLIWLLVKLAYEFLGYTRVANISAHYYHVLMTASTVMFLLYYFKSTAKGFAASAASVAGLSLPAAMFSCMTVIPSFIDALTGEVAYFFDAVTGFDFACLLTAVFAVIVSAKLAFAQKNAMD